MNPTNELTIDSSLLGLSPNWAEVRGELVAIFAYLKKRNEKKGVRGGH